MEDKDCPGCEILETKPAKVAFKFEIHSRNDLTEEVTVMNKTDVPQIVIIREPMTQYFHMNSFIQKGIIQPRGQIRFYLSFKKEREPRGYQDCVILECCQGCNLELRIEALPIVKEFKELPKEIKFGHVPLGQVRKKKLILEPKKEEVPFLFVLLKYCPEINISPSKGVVGKDPVEIEITYRPMAYITLMLHVNVYLPSIIRTPYTILLSAHTKPGYYRSQLLDFIDNAEDYKEEKNVYRIPLSAKPVAGKVRKEEQPWSQHQANIFLMKDHQKADAEIKGPLGRYLGEEEAIRNRKEKDFFDLVHKIKRENDIVNSHEKNKIRSIDADWFDRERQRQQYIAEKNMENHDFGYGPQLIRQRNIRDAKETHNFQFTGPERKPNEWFVRYMNMVKFINAARKIVVKRRMEKVLQKLKRVTKEDIKSYEAAVATKKEEDYGF